MSNKISLGSSHEHQIRLSPAQREAIIMRYAPRFTRGQVLADRAAWAMHHITPVEIEPVAPAASAPQTEETQRSVGSNVITMEAWRQRQAAARGMGRINLNGPDSDNPSYDLEDIRRTVHNSYIVEAKSYPIEQRNPYDQEAA